MRRSKVGDPEIQANVVKLVKEAGMPVSVEYIAHNLDVAWATARGILFELALRREIIAEKTTKSWIFQWRKGFPNPSSNLEKE